MNSIHKNLLTLGMILVIGACAAPKEEDPRVTRLKNDYELLASNPSLGPLGGEDLKAAETAIRRLSDPKKSYKERDFELALFTTDRLIKVAEFEARARLADNQRGRLAIERERLVATARTREAQQAREMADEARRETAEALAMTQRARAEAAEAEKIRDAARAAQLEAEKAQASAADMQRMAEQSANAALLQAQERTEEAEAARMAADAARMAADAAKTDADAARLATEAAKAEALAFRAEAEAARADREQMRVQLADLEAKQTDRGLLLTLGDVLFEFNQSDLKPGVARNLASLVDVLTKREDQIVIVEGHTDSVGNRPYNMTLSEKRAGAVRDFLIESGINSSRIATEGLGPDLPVATNDTAEGRQKNRRVEVILPTVDTVKN